MKLATINRLLRWTGFALIVSTDSSDGPTREPTRLSLMFLGWRDPDAAWARHCRRSAAIATISAGDAGALISDTQGGDCR